MPENDDLVETIEINTRIGLYVLDALADEALAWKPPKGRSAADVVAHIHNVRLMWLQSAAPGLLEGLAKFESKAAPTKAELRAALDLSGQRVAEMLRQGIASGRIKGFKPHPAAFLAYLVSHESYHLGEAGMLAAQSGHPLDRKTAFGMWEWGSR